MLLAVAVAVRRALSKATSWSDHQWNIIAPTVLPTHLNVALDEVRARFDDPVPARYVDELVERVPEFVQAYEPDGLSIAGFDTYGATVRTLRTFIGSYWDLVRTIDDLLLPDPDVRPA